MGGLFRKICELDTLRQAWYRIKKKGAQGGIDGISVAEFDRDADSNLEALAEALRNNQYAPDPTERIYVPKFNEAGEFRPLSLPIIQDKVAQQAVRSVIEPLFERVFLDCSYAYRPGKGPRKAIGRVKHYIQQEKRNWAVFGDLDNFFDTLNHDRLLDEVRKVVVEPEILGLIRMWLKIGTIDQRGRYHDMVLGTTQGGIISPCLSNVYAHPLDEYLVSQGIAYVRYADNFIALSRSREEAEKQLQMIQSFIATLQLRLNPETKPIKSVEEGFVFLGIFFRGTKYYLAREKTAKIKRKLDWLTHKKRPYSLNRIMSELTEAVDAVRRYYGFLNPVRAFEDLDRHLVYRLRVLFRARRATGQITYKTELRGLLTNRLFFVGVEGPKCQGLRDSLVEEVFSDKYPSRPTDSTAARGKPASSLAAAKKETREAPKETVHLLDDQLVQGDATPADGNVLPDISKAQPTERPFDRPTAEAGSTRPKTPSAEEQRLLKTADQKVASKKRHHVRRQFLESELVVFSPGTMVGCRQNRVVLTSNRKKVYDRPLIKIKSILVSSRGVTFSSDLIRSCAKMDIPIVFSSFAGRCYAMIHSPLQARPDLGLKQLEVLADGTALNWAKKFVLGKLKNQLNLLKFYLRHREETDPEYSVAMEETEPKLEEIQDKVRDLQPEIPYEKQRNQLFGLEGQAGVHYWRMVRLLLPAEVGFTGRITQGAEDLVNMALNYGYSLLYPRIERALLLAGLNVNTSLFHSPQLGKPTLSFDLIEIFRTPVVDRAIFSMLTRGKNLAITTQRRLSSESAREIMEAVTGRLGTLVPYGKERHTLEQVIHRQARLLARSLRQEGRFKPFVSRY